MTSEQHRKFHREYMREWKKRPENKEYYRRYMQIYRKTGKGCRRKRATFSFPTEPLNIPKKEKVEL